MNATTPSIVVNTNVIDQSERWPIHVPIGTPKTFAIVNPPKIIEMANPRFASGTASLATSMASEIKTPVTIAVSIRKASNNAYVGAKLLNKLKTMKAKISPRMSGRFGKWLVKDIVSGVPMANVSANADTRVPAVAMEMESPCAMSGKIPTITNSLVPRTNVSKDNDKMSIQSERRSVESVVKTCHFFLFCC